MTKTKPKSTANWGAKYRPTSIKTLLVDDDMRIVLEDLERELPSVLCISGDTGCGKTTVARILARKAAGDNVDEMNVADNNGVDDMRAVAEKSKYAPLGGGCKVIILDEAHTITKAGASALLKALEDVPEWTKFILATNEPAKLLKTLRSRIMHIVMEKPRSDLLLKRCKSVLKEEGKEVPTKKIEKLIKACDGQPRLTLNSLRLLALNPNANLAGIIIDADREDKGALAALIEFSRGNTSYIDVINGTEENKLVGTVMAWIGLLIARITKPAPWNKGIESPEDILQRCEQFRQMVINDGTRAAVAFILAFGG